MKRYHTLGERLGLTTHISILDMKVKRLFAEYPSNTAKYIEDWLLDVANSRGARIVQRDNPPQNFLPPSGSLLPNEELVAAICLLQRADYPQLLRLAGQLISRGNLNIKRLIHIAKLERIEIVLGEMARQALKVDPNHSIWKQLAVAFPLKRHIKSPIIHWQRLAWPVMTNKGYNAEKWILVK